MPRPRLHDDALRERMLEVTSELVSTEGTAALTVREAARRAGTSPSAVYALFGSREHLLRAVGEEAFRRFAEHLAAVPRTDDPAADLLELGMAYRRSALAAPHFYRVMFDTVGTGARDADHGPATTSPTFVTLQAAVTRALLAAHVPPAAAGPAAASAAETLWGLAHGLVGLELAGLLPGAGPERESAYREALRAAGGAVLG